MTFLCDPGMAGNPFQTQQERHPAPVLRNLLPMAQATTWRRTDEGFTSADRTVVGFATPHGHLLPVGAIR